MSNLLNLPPVAPDLPVLVVEDDADARHMLCQCLALGGNKVTEAADAAQALDVLASEHHPVVILDLNLPGTSGFDLCRQIREDNRIPFAYIIMVTGRCEQQLRFEALANGADDFLIKPLNIDEALIRVRVGQRLHLAHADEVRRALLDRERKALTSVITNMEEALGVIVHDLRTPLTGFHMMLELLEEGNTRGEQESEYLGIMATETLRMSRLLDRLLTVARCQSGCTVRAFSEIDLCDVCRSAECVVRGPAAERGVTVDLDLPPSLPMRADADALSQLLVNLLNNALTHSKAGTITVALKPSISPKGSAVELAVSDTGEGIDEQTLEGLNTALASEKSVIEVARETRAGFGLAICRDIAAAHHGALSIESTPGEGTTVRVRLRTDAAEPPVQKSKAASRAAA